MYEVTEKGTKENILIFKCIYLEAHSIKTEQALDPISNRISFELLANGEGSYTMDL